jgi:hypothetical protein
MEGAESNFMLYATGLIFGGTEGAISNFHILCFGTHFWLYLGCRVQFSCFVLHDSFSTVPRASGPDFMFCAPGYFFVGTEGAGSSFHVLLSRTCLGGTAGAGSSLYVLRFRPRFRRYRGRQD